MVQSLPLPHRVQACLHYLDLVLWEVQLVVKPPQWRKQHMTISGQVKQQILQFLKWPFKMDFLTLRR